MQILKKFSIDEFRQKPIPNEQEITSTWSSPHKTPLVSIICITYNQDKYIEDAIRGFLIQKTDFPFEIIIHDDASTDKTRPIIRKYSELYPKIIKPIFQTENQYTKSKNSVVQIPFSLAQGEYLAFCEGDDFWFDENKLNEQILTTKSHPKIGLFFHPALALKDEKPLGIINYISNKTTTITTSEVIKGGGGFMPSASLLIKKDFIKNLPDWFLDAPVGDYYIQAIASTMGACYTHKPRCVYRYASSTSVSQAHLNSDISKIIDYYQTEIDSLEKLNKHLNHTYKSEILFRKATAAQSCAALLLERSDFSNFKRLINKSCEYKSYVCRQQRLLKAFANHPRTAKFLTMAIRKASYLSQSLRTLKHTRN